MAREKLVDAVVSKVDAAFKLERNWPLKERISWLKELKHLINKERTRILSVVAREKQESERQVLQSEFTATLLLCNFYLKNAKKILSAENRSSPLSFNFGNKKAIIKKEPLGTVGIISPASHPLSLSLGAAIPALLAGNSVVLKPSPETPATNDLAQYLLKRTLGKFGVSDFFEMLPADDRYGQALVECPAISKIHFTGSTAVGVKVSELNSKTRSAPPTLKLGGSNAAIILEDADIQQAARVVVWARFSSMSCNNIKRVFAVAPVYEEFFKEVENQVRSLQNHEFPPVLEREQVRYRIFMDDYYRKQANPYAAPKEGFIVPVVLRVDELLGEEGKELLVLREETFVPILPIAKVSNETEAIIWANRTSYGLGASIFTKSKAKFQNIASMLDCGAVFHNDAMTEFFQPKVPFGGWKSSGCGYAHGPEGLLEFIRLKTVIEERWPISEKINFLKKIRKWVTKSS